MQRPRGERGFAWWASYAGALLNRTCGLRVLKVLSQDQTNYCFVMTSRRWLPAPKPSSALLLEQVADSRADCHAREHEEQSVVVPEHKCRQEAQKGELRFRIE